MKRVSRLVALSLVFTLVFASAVFAASPSTSNTTTTSSSTGSTPAAAYTQSVQAQLAAPAAVFAGGIESASTSGGAAVAVAPVTVSAVNYATLAARLIAGPTATVLKAVALAPAAGAKAGNVTLKIPGIVKGQNLMVIAFDPLTNTWVKVKGVKVRNGQLTFNMGQYMIFSVVSNTIAP